MGGVVSSIFGGGGGGSGGGSSASSTTSNVTVNPTTNVSLTADLQPVADVVNQLTQSNQALLAAVEVANQQQITKMSSDFQATMTSLQDHMAQSDKLNLLIAAGSIAYLVFGHKKGKVI